MRRSLLHLNYYNPSLYPLLHTHFTLYYIEERVKGFVIDGKGFVIEGLVFVIEFVIEDRFVIEGKVGIL